ncbi:MAG: GIY-YIG nuclease family protein [Planctomycetota bacterium]
MTEQHCGYVYILKSGRNGTYYTGSTDNLEKRLKRHNGGLVKATRNIRPLTLMFCQKYDTLPEARRIEYRLKRLKSRKVIEQIINDGCIKMEVTRP